MLEILKGLILRMHGLWMKTVHGNIGSLITGSDLPRASLSIILKSAPFHSQKCPFCLIKNISSISLCNFREVISILSLISHFIICKITCIRSILFYVILFKLLPNCPVSLFSFYVNSLQLYCYNIGVSLHFPLIFFFSFLFLFFFSQ